MGLKKYEIITVGSDKRVRALRSWQVGDRYVNIGDVGGIVYDEKTLSQDGACWLFRGNFGFPGARIGGDSIVDVGEANLPVKGSPVVDILGSSVVVGNKLLFESDRTAADALTLGAADFEQGGTTWVSVGASYESMKTSSGVFLRSKNPIFLGGVGVTLKCGVPGYTVVWNLFDRDMNAIIASSAGTNTGGGVTVAVPAGQYLIIGLAKNPSAPIVPADATAAQIAFTGAYETKLSVIDSRVEINPATSTGTTIIRPGGTYTFASGAKYPEAIIRNSKVSMSVPAVASRSYRIMGQIIESNATLDATAGDVSVAGQYSNIKNLMASGTITSNLGVTSYNVIQAYDCDNMVVSPTIFPGLAAAQTANMPFIFRGCNVPNGIFYHHAQIANTYKNIDFALAQADLGKSVPGVAYTLVSSETEGMYRIYNTAANLFGLLAESYDSISSIGLLVATASSYGTTIYKDAYVSGRFDFAGTNVFGNTKKHDTSNAQDISGALVMGLFNATTNGSTISGVVANNARAVVAQPFRVSWAGGILVSSPAGVECNIYLTDATNTILVNTGYVSGTNAPIVPASPAVYAYVAVKKADGSDISSLDEIKGVTVTTYNGCKIVNTGTTAVNMKGNIRVEDNATLVNASVVGSGYFGGNAVMSGAFIGGCVYMRDNASFTKTAGSLAIRNLKMTENAYAVLGNYPLNGRIHLSDNARCTPTAAGLSGGDLVMKDNAVISGAVAVDGVITMKDNAKVSEGTLSAYGDITLCGSYNQTVNKTWTGKRVIDNENAPGYDDNVKTQYDF